MSGLRYSFIPNLIHDNFKLKFIAAFYWVCFIIIISINPGPVQAVNTPLIVDSLLDTDGASCVSPCTLRQAINVANAQAGQDTINFSVFGTINLGSALPALSDDAGVIIDDNRVTCATLAACTFNVTLNGGSAGDHGLQLSSLNNTVRGLVINNFTSNFKAGIYISRSNNTVTLNRIGMAANGTTTVSNFWGIALDKIFPTDDISSVTISKNLVSANSDKGIFIQNVVGTGNTITGNIVGPDISGNNPTNPQRQPFGIYIYNSSNLLIGGDVSDVAKRNIISNNYDTGIYISATLVRGSNLIQGNYIGPRTNGDQTVGDSSKGQNKGIHILGFSENNLIGGTTVNTGNVISGNLSAGVYFEGVSGNPNQVQGNIIGPAATGTKQLSGGVQPRGVLIQGITSNILVGGTTAAARNIISGNNESQVYFLNAVADPATPNQVLGNYIGTDNSGNKVLGVSTLGDVPAQQYGVYVLDVNNPNGNTTNLTIGGTSPNIISGNRDTGIYFYNNSSSASGINVKVVGNIIGPTQSGNTVLDYSAIPPAFLQKQKYGVYLRAASNNLTIGDPALNLRNYISANTDQGIWVESGGHADFVYNTWIGYALNGSLLKNGKSGIKIFAGGQMSFKANLGNRVNNK